MKNIPEEVIQEWAAKKQYIQDRLNRLKKKIKKYQKQEMHFQMRMKFVRQYEKEHGKIIKK